MIDTPTLQQRRQRVPATAESFWLVPVLSSSEIGPSVLADGETEIGSESTCDIFLPVPGVDAHHCSIRTDSGRATLTAHSRMTWINDGPVSKTVLKPGQRLAVGPVEFRIERRPGTVPSDPLEQVAALQRAVSGEIHEPAAPSITPSITPSPIATSDSPPLPGGQPPAPAERPSAAAVISLAKSAPAAIPPVAGSRVANGSAALQELERRRALVEKLQTSLTEQAGATLQALKENAAAQQMHQDEVSRIRGELSASRAELLNDRAALARQQVELQRQSLRLQENEQSLCTRQTEFGQSLEDWEQQRRDLYGRENLLQQRIDEINQSEAALAASEAELLKRQQEWEQHCADQDTASEREAERASWEAEREAFSAQRQKLDEDFRNLQQQRQTCEARLEEMRVIETRLTEQQSDRERHQRELETREASVREREQELEALENAPKPEQGDDLDQTREDLARSQAELNQARQSLLNERERLDGAITALREQQQTLATEQLELRGSQADIAQRTAELEEARGDLDALQEQLKQQREQLIHDQETFIAEQARAAADRESAELAPGDAFGSTGTLSEAENDRQTVLDTDQHPDEYEVTDACSEATAELDTDSFDDEIVDDADIANADVATDAKIATGADVAADTDVAETAAASDMKTETENNARAGTGTAAVPEEGSGLGLRSQLAELFGVSTDDLNARATDCDADSQPPASQALHEEESPYEEQFRHEEQAQHEDSLNEEESDEGTAQNASVQETAPSAHEPETSAQTLDAEPSDETDDEQEPDSISTYMEKLIARNRGSVESARVIAPGASVPRPQSPKRAASTTRAITPEQPPDVPEVTADSVRRAQRKRPNMTLERASIDAFRDLANRSARSAVAMHNSSSLRIRFIVTAILTAILFGITVILMTAHFWVGTSYPWCGLLTAAAMCVSAFELLKTASQLQSNNVQQRVGPDGTAEDALLRIIKRLACVAERLSMKRQQIRCEGDDYDPADVGSH